MEVVRLQDDPYLMWLYEMVGPAKPYRTYKCLISELHSIRFQPVLLEMDSNRANDGLRLRVDFMEEHGPLGSSSDRGQCTMLELIIGIAKRMDFLMATDENGRNIHYYFWKMIENLGLVKLEDDSYYRLNGSFFVLEACNRVIFRNHDANGKGGLFPVKRPREDMRNLDIWYQMQAWLSEHNELNL